MSICSHIPVRHGGGISSRFCVPLTSSISVFTLPPLPPTNARAHVSRPLEGSFGSHAERKAGRDGSGGGRPPALGPRRVYSIPAAGMVQRRLPGAAKDNVRRLGRRPPREDSPVRLCMMRNLFLNVFVLSVGCCACFGCFGCFVCLFACFSFCVLTCLFRLLCFFFFLRGGGGKEAFTLCTSTGA